MSPLGAGDSRFPGGSSGAGRRRTCPRLLTDHSAYDRTVLYDTFDVTRMLRAGRENVLAAELGRGLYGLTTPQEWYWHLAPYAGAPRLRAKLVVTHRADRTTTVVRGCTALARHSLSVGPRQSVLVLAGHRLVVPQFGEELLRLLRVPLHGTALGRAETDSGHRDVELLAMAGGDASHRLEQ